MVDMKSAPGPSDIAAWQRQIIKPGAVVSQTNPNAPGASAQAIELYNMSAENRKQIALALKNAGYKVPTNGIFSNSLVTAFSTATLAAQTQAQLLGIPFDSKFFENFLIQERDARAATGTTGTKKSIAAKVSNETDAKALINTIIKDQLGREATADEIKRYTSALQKAQKAAPVTTTYTTKGGVTTSQTTGGINEQQYLIDRVSGTDEAKANKVLSFYETFMNALGRD